jgi:hypothetical protein
MITLIAAAAMAAQAPAAPPPADAQAQHMQQMQMGEHAQHQGTDCCKDCCDEKAATHDGHGAGHAEHGAAK